MRMRWGQLRRWLRGLKLETPDSFTCSIVGWPSIEPVPMPMADHSPAVLGDAGRLYVSADIIPIYKELLLHSTIITPNWFEVESVQRTVPRPALADCRPELSQE
jgi:hypothetical protein